MGQVRRRQILIAAGALLAAPHALAQPAGAPRRIGWLSPGSPESDAAFVGAFVAKMKELGYIEGRDYAIELRHSRGRTEQLTPLARELLALKPAVIVTAGSAGVAALGKETKTVPVVFGTAADVVEQGFVASLARPGGNITGVTLRSEVFGKLVELIRETLPSTQRIALLEHETDPVAKRITDSTQRAAATLGYRLIVARVKRAEEFERAFTEMAHGKAEALIVPALTLFAVQEKKLVELALKWRLPLFSTRNFTSEGGFLSYYSDARENYRRVAMLVDKIFKSAKPADLPIEEPDRFTLAVNARTAKTLGITIPRSILARADRVIE